MTKAAREPRRLETGDWVRVRGDEPSIRGVAKLIDADVAREDGALTACQVEVGARTLWLSPADLVRITPDEEARLCDVALARGLVPDERRARLDAALRELRAGKRAVIRTPGLLDLLWSTSTLADPTHGSGAVTAFLAEEAFAPIRPARAAPAPEPLLERPRACPTPAPEPDVEPEPRAAPADERLLRVLAPLDRSDLIGLASRCGVNFGPNPVALDLAMMQRLIAAAGVTAVAAASALDPRHPPREVLEQALAVLDDDQLAPLAAECGFQQLLDGREAFLSLPNGDVLTRALNLMTENQLHSLCDHLGMEPMWQALDHTDVCARIEAVATPRVEAALS